MMRPVESKVNLLASPKIRLVRLSCVSEKKSVAFSMSVASLSSSSSVQPSMQGAVRLPVADDFR